MTIGLCPAFFPGQQYFDADGNVLAGGLLFCTAISYTSRSGFALNTNPIVLDASGRMKEEIWLEFGANATFTLQTPLGVTIGSWSSIYPYNDTNLPTANDVAFNASLGIQNILPQSFYSQSSNPKTALSTSPNLNHQQSGTPNATCRMVTYPRIFARQFSAVKIGVKMTSLLSGSAGATLWRFLIHEANADGSPGAAVVDTGPFSLVIVDGWIFVNISYTFQPNKIYWFGIAWNFGIPGGFQYYTIGNTVDGDQYSLGAAFETGVNFVNDRNWFYLVVLNSAAPAITDPVLANNPPVVIDFNGYDNATAPIFYLHSA